MDSESEVGAGSEELGEANDEEGADAWAKPGGGNAGETAGCELTGEDEEACDEAESDAGDGGGEQPGEWDGSEGGRGVIRQGEVEDGVMSAGEGTDAVSEPCGGEAQGQGAPVRFCGAWAFDGEESGGAGGAENGAEASGHPGEEDDPGPMRRELERAGDSGGDATAELDGGAFAPGGASGQMGEEGGTEDPGSESEGDLDRIVVDGIDEEVGAASGCSGIAGGDPDDGDAGDGEEGDEPGVVLMQVGYPGEGLDEGGAGETGRDRHGEESDGKAQEILSGVAGRSWR